MEKINNLTSSDMGKKFLGLRTVIYKVSDLKRAKEWYSKVLGFAPYFDQPFYVGFSVGGFELGLVSAEQGHVASLGGATAYWGVDNVQRSFDELVAAGATAIEKPTEVGGGIVVASVRDPWNNPFGIIYNPEFKAE